MRQLLLFFFCTSILFSFSLNAQTGCPGCAVSLPSNLPADTLYLQNLPDGKKGDYYDQDISFRMPMTTTPVNAVDSTTPPGLPIAQIEIVAIEDLPPGLYWEPNKFVFDTGNADTDGCVKFCGTPLQSDTFVMTVRIKATVFFITQEATFPLRVYIAPDVSATDGFTMTNFTGCGSTTVSFTNNIPSGGAPGFAYEWDFGDSTTFVGENPPPHTYSVPGIYPVNYHATIDTSGYVLASVQIVSVECGDALSDADLYFFIKSPTGETVFNSQPDVVDAPLPYTWPVNLQLGAGNYSIEVWEEDSGIKGTDDPCGSIPFNILSNGTLTAGGLTLVLNIVHDVEEIFSTDSVIVYPQPEMPFIEAPNGLAECAGTDSVLLVSSAGAGNHWWLDGEAIANATDFLYQPMQTGFYQVQVITSYGCSAISDSTLVEIYPLPALPVYNNINNSLRLADTMALPDEYALQWYNGDDPIPGETGFRYCATANGNYGLSVTDLTTGCTNFFVTSVIHDPNFDCTIGTDDVPSLTLGISPNPAYDMVQISFGQNLPNGGLLRVWDVAGRLAKTTLLPTGIDIYMLDCGDLHAGLFTLEIVTDDGFRGVGKVVVMR